MSEQQPNGHETDDPVDICPAAGENFFRHVNDEWLKETEIPASSSRWGAFDILRHKTSERLAGIAEAASRVLNPKKGSNEQLVGDFYKSYTDMETRNALGLAPIDTLRSQIDAIQGPKELATCIAELSLMGPNAFMGMTAAEDKRNAGFNVFYLGQGGYRLPDRDYYLSGDESMRKTQEQYREHLTNMFKLAGRNDEDAVAAAKSVYDIEYELAKASRPRAEVRKSENNYTKYTIDDFKAEFRGIDWDAYFAGMGIPDISEIVVRQPEFLTRLGTLMRETDMSSLKNYLEIALLEYMAPSLSQEFIDEKFDFFGTKLSGITEQKPIEERAISALGATDLVNASGPLYCELYFDQSDKVRLTQIVEDVCRAFARRVEALDWMTPETKALTLQKLAGIDFKMGFPDKWIDVSSVDVRPDEYAENRMRLTRFQSKRILAQVGKPYDRSEWSMAPTTVNACADLKRDMTFPAAILQPPFYDPTRDDAYNYGAIGAVIGHELSHFFDDQGSKYDLDGNLRDWWSLEDRTNFEGRAQSFVDYYSMQSADGLPVNGELTQGENIADVAGVMIAYDAYQASQARADADDSLDGLTPEQRFFTGFAKVWPTKERPEHAKQSRLADPHSPAEVRVNATLGINQAFLDAFGIKPDDPMYVPEDKRPKLLW
ncbi:MAG: M13 family metallopeptidase [Candidatus Saccharimonadales bacterium]